jgi:hypothetical protein
MKMISVFSLFRVMEHRWNESDRGKPKYLGKKSVPVPLCPPQIPHGCTRDRTRASAVGGRRLTAWAMARPYHSCYMSVHVTITIGLLLSVCVRTVRPYTFVSYLLVTLSYACFPVPLSNTVELRDHVWSAHETWNVARFEVLVYGDLSRKPASEMWHRVVWQKLTDISEERTASTALRL